MAENKELTTLFTGRHCILLENADSTNIRLAELISKKSLPQGSAVRAKNQSNGKGQKGASWFSEAGKNLLQSFVFYPAFLHSMQVFMLNKAFALGVYDFISARLGEKTSIKWPNDIYAGHKKVAGILLENSISGNKVNASILGIGINVNQEIFPAELENATSFSIETKQHYDLEELFFSLCSCLEARYLSLERGEVEKTEHDYVSALYGRGEQRNFKSGDNKFSGIIKGVNETGRLVVEKEDGSETSYDIREIAFLQAP